MWNALEMKWKALPLLLMTFCAPMWGEEVATASTSLAEQSEVAITAYNNGLGLVKDTRTLTLATGKVRLAFQDVPEQVQPATVSLRSLNHEGSVTILEQNYEYDLISPETLMNKYVGKDVRLVNFSEELGFSEVTAKLLSTNGGAVYEVGGVIYTGHPGYVVLPQIPEDLRARPSLIWELENSQPEQELQATYLTQGISWQADYVVTIPKGAQQLDLKSWVTLTNNSGATYTNAQLKLIAGALNLVPQKILGVDEVYFDFDRSAGAADKPVEETFAEYHLYTMPRRTTLKQNQSKQVALLDAAGVGFVTRYEFNADSQFFYGACPPRRNAKAVAYVEFENREANHLGMPLPAGTMRLYQEDAGGSLQFAGEDHIDHTPKDEKIRLRMGEAFDIVVDQIQSDFRVIGANVFESAHEITLRNHKATDVVVDVVEPLTGDWRMLEQSMEFEKKDAQSIVFHAPVKAGSETKVTYRVQVRH